MKLVLPQKLADQIARAAHDALPKECCGLIVGERDETGWRASALHPAANLAASSDRFLIDPSDHIQAAKAARAGGHAVIGCYHSHPNGAPAPSATDLAGAAEEDFLWLIAAVTNARCDIAVWRYLRGRFTGADWVTSSE